MAYNIFLDVNIVVDFFLNSREGHAEAVRLIGAAEKEIVNIYLSESVINTTAYLVRKSIHYYSFKEGMNEMLIFGKVLPCSNMIVRNAYRIAKNDLEDAVLYQLAMHHKLDFFVTSDIKDFRKIQHPLLPVVTAEKMLDILKS
jgi:predicted nucleic acid-binding protein